MNPFQDVKDMGSYLKKKVSSQQAKPIVSPASKDDNLSA